MRFRVILLIPSVTNYPTMNETFQLGSASRKTRCISSVLRPVVSVLCWSGESYGLVGWHKPDARWERVLSMCLPDTIPSHARSPLRGNTPIAPCGTASFCFPGALQNKFENSGRERRSNFFRPAPKKALLGTHYERTPPPPYGQEE